MDVALDAIRHISEETALKEESIPAKRASEMTETVERMVMQSGLAEVHCDRLSPPSSAWRTTPVARAKGGKAG